MTETSRPPVPDAVRPDDTRPTEDDIAQQQLGGPRGNPALAPAPITPQRAKKTPNTPADGHTE